MQKTKFYFSLLSKCGPDTFNELGDDEREAAIKFFEKHRDEFSDLCKKGMVGSVESMLILSVDCATAYEKAFIYLFLHSISNAWASNLNSYTGDNNLLKQIRTFRKNNVAFFKFYQKSIYQKS